MKLKEAIELAKELVAEEGVSIRWIAVDEDLAIWAYEAMPRIELDSWEESDNAAWSLGQYTGSKYWDNTLTEVGQ